MTTTLLTYNNETLKISEWAKRFNISNQLIRQRLERNWDLHKIFHTPPIAPKTHGHGGNSDIGLRPSYTYYTWIHIKRRCYNPRSKAYSRYGGKGITVCDRWINSFENFLADMGEKPSRKHSIDRINNSLGYFPENCRWATQKQQCRNQSTNRYFFHEGENLTLAEWSERKNINRGTITTRIDRYGWSIEKALNTPAMQIFGGRHQSVDIIHKNLPEGTPDS